VGAAAVLAAVLAAPASAVTIMEFPAEPGAPPGAHEPRYIEAGPDGNLWWTDSPVGISRISTAGERLAPIADAMNQPVDIATAPDGTVYWTGDLGRGQRNPDGRSILRRTNAPSYALGIGPAGTPVWGERVTTPPVGAVVGTVCTGWEAQNCAGGTTDTRIIGLALAADGRMWGTAYEGNALWRIRPELAGRDLVIDLPPGSGPSRLVLGPDGNLWVTMFDASAIDRVAPTGFRTRFALPPGTRPNDITVGPDGALWFTGYGSNTIGRMTTAGVLTNEFPIPTAASLPIGIAAGADGSIWFTESAADKIGRLQLDPPRAGSGGGGGGGGGTVSDRTAPRFLRAPAFSPARFRVSGARTPVSAGVQRGTTLTYSLSEAAAVTITIARARSGRRVGGRCRRPTRANRGRPRCTRYVAAGTLRRAALQGANTLAFSGRIGRRALPAGSYRAALRARDAAGNRSPARTARFTVVSGR
jgi:streptogramin lyase